MVPGRRDGSASATRSRSSASRVADRAPPGRRSTGRAFGSVPRRGGVRVTCAGLPGRQAERASTPARCGRESPKDRDRCMGMPLTLRGGRCEPGSGGRSPASTMPPLPRRASSHRRGRPHYGSGNASGRRGAYDGPPHTQPSRQRNDPNGSISTRRAAPAGCNKRTFVAVVATYASPDPTRAPSWTARSRSSPPAPTCPAGRSRRAVARVRARGRRRGA